MGTSTYYPELNLNELKLFAQHIRRGYPAIVRISLYRSAEPKYKYILLIEVDDSDPKEYEAAIEAYVQEYVDVFNEFPWRPDFIRNHEDQWFVEVGNINEKTPYEFPTLLALKNTGYELYSKSNSEGPVGNESLRKTQVSYENKEQFKIKIPGKPFKPCSYHDLGCRSAETKEFQYLLKAIQYGNIKLLDRKKQKAFERGCQKFFDYMREKYFASLPEDLKIFEKGKDHNYWLIFERAEDRAFGHNRNLENMTKNELLTELKRLVQEPIPQKVKDEKEWRKIQNEKITETAQEALERGVDREEVKNIIDPPTVKSFYEDETRECEPDDIAKASIFGEKSDNEE